MRSKGSEKTPRVRARQTVRGCDGIPRESVSHRARSQWLQHGVAQQSSHRAQHFLQGLFLAACRAPFFEFVIHLENKLQVYYARDFRPRYVEVEEVRGQA